MSRPALFLVALLAATSFGGCATVSVYEPAEAEISLADTQSVLHKASDAYCRDARSRGLATGEASLGSLADMLTGKDMSEGAYWRLIGADRSAPASIVSRVRADMGASAKGLADLDAMARKLLGAATPTKDDVSEFERALIHARQARDSLSDALAQVNKRSDREYQVTLELTPFDEVLTKARSTADELASARAEEALSAAAS